jgi:hypothetical protein
VKSYEGVTWSRLRDHGGAVYEDLVLNRCTFVACSLGEAPWDPLRRTIVRRVRASKCKIDGGPNVGPVIFEDVIVSDLRWSGAFAGWFMGTLFKHVVFSGKWGSLVLDNDVSGPMSWSPDRQAPFDEHAREFYSTVDWALDISAARFRDFDWRLNIPSRLVRRDPVTQVVVKRERALEGAWRKIPLHGTIAIALDNFVNYSAYSEKILVACRAASAFKQELESIQALRDAGIVEPEQH